MIRFFFFTTALLLLAIFAAPAAHSQESWAGDWHGTLATPGGALRLVLTVRPGAGGALTAEVEIPDQAPGSKIPVDTIAIADGRMTFAIAALHVSYEGAWHPETGRFSGTFTQGVGMPLELARGGLALPVIAGLDGTWRGTVVRNGVPLRLILRITTGANGTIASLDSPDTLGTGVPIADLARDGTTVSFAIPAGQARYRATLAPDGNGMTGTWSRTGSPDAQVTLVRGAQAAASPRRRPQTPHPPFPYRAEEVRFDNARAPGVTLAGTLTLPPGRGPFPAAILITGSGPEDRDETIFGHKPFAVIADHLTRSGIAVLRVDDRGVGASTGAQDGATSADFATDANAAFAFLRARPEIDRHAIGFIGHSEGGMIGPLAARDNPDTAFLVLLAAPGTPIRQLMEAQRRAIGHSMGQSDAEIDRAMAVQDAFFAAAMSDEDATAAAARLRATLTDEMLQAAATPVAARDQLVRLAGDPWFRSFARYDPGPALARIRVPVLALNGSLDEQVVARENLTGIRAALAGNPDVTVRELPGLNHMFQTARTGSPGEYADIEETFAPAALDLISSWIRTRFIRGR